MLGKGGEVWASDETTLREFPPLRAAWARRGAQQVVLISGTNSRCVLHGALALKTGELVTMRRARCRTDDVVALLEALRTVRPAVPKLLIWDNAPPHHPKAVRAAAAAANIELAYLPFRSPELNPCEDLWRRLKARVAANRVAASVEALGEQADQFLAQLGPAGILQASSLNSSKFQWLPT